MAEISTIVTGIETRVAAVLGSSYSEMAYIANPNDNSFRGSSNKYGVQAGDITQSEDKGVTRSFTVTQNFHIKLTTDYASSNTGDSVKLAAEVTLLEKHLEIYKDLVNTRCGASSTVIQTLDLSVDEPEYLDDNNVILTTGSVSVVYRKAL